MPRRGSLQVPQPRYTLVERTGPVLPAQTNLVGAEVPTDAAHAGVVTSSNATTNSATQPLELADVLEL